MKTFAKVLGVLIAIGVVLIGAAVVLVPMFVDPNEYRPQIVEQVKQQTGRELRIGGEVDLSVFPWLSVKLADVELGNAPGFEAPFFAKVERMEVRVKLLPLFGSNVEMDTISVDGLTVNLARNESGMTNWEDLLPAEEAPDTSSAPGEKAALTAFAIGGIDVRDAAVSWQDQQAGEHFRVRNLSLQTGGLSLDRPVAITLDLELEDLTSGLSGHLAMKADLGVDLAQQRFTASAAGIDATLSGGVIGPDTVTIRATTEQGSFDATGQKLEVSGLTLESEGLALAEGRATVTIKGGVLADLETQTVTSTGLDFNVTNLAVEGAQANFSGTAAVIANLGTQVLQIDALALDGRVEGERIGDGNLIFELTTELDVDLETERLTVRNLVLEGTLESDKVPNGNLPIKVAGSTITFDRVADALAIVGLEVAAGEMTGAIEHLSASNLSQTPSLQGNISLKKLNPRLLLDVAGIEVPPTTDPKALTRASIELGFTATGEQVKVKPVVLVLDGATLRGSVRIVGFEKPAVTFNLRWDALDVDRYLPPGDETVATPAAAAPSALGLPVEALRAFNAKGSLRAGELKVSGIRLEKPKVNLNAEQGLIAVESTFRMYRGRYVGKIELDARGDAVTLSVAEKINGLRADLLFAALGTPAPVALNKKPSDFAVSFTAEGDLAKQQYRFDNIAVNASIGAKGGFPKGLLVFRVRGGADLDLGVEKLDLRDLKVGAFGGEITSSLEVSKFLSDPSYAGAIKLSELNVREFLTAISKPVPKTADPEVLKSFTLEARLEGDTRQVKMKKIRGKLDDTPIGGRIWITDLATLATTFRLRGNRLDLDRYLPPQTDGQKVATPGAAMTLLPVETLRALDLEGDLKFKTLIVSKIELNQVVLKAVAKDGVLNLNPLSANLWEKGSYAGNVRIDASGAQPKLTIDERLTDLPMRRLLGALSDTDVLGGTGTLRARLQAVGNTEAEIRRTLNGDIDFSVVRGSIRGIDIVSQICNGLSEGIAGLLTGGGGKIKDTNKTKFSDLAGTLQVTKGVAHNEDLVMKSPLLRVTGSGLHNLVKDATFYNAVATIVGSCEGQGGTAGSQLAGIQIPVKITGPLSNLEYDVQVEKIIGQLGNGSGAGSGALENVLEQPEEAIKGLLEGVLGQ